MRKGDSIECPDCASLRRYCHTHNFNTQAKPICPACYDKTIATRLYEGNRQHVKNKWDKLKGLIQPRKEK